MAFAHLATGCLGAKASPSLYRDRKISYFFSALCLVPTVAFPQRQAVPVTLANQPSLICLPTYSGQLGHSFSYSEEWRPGDRRNRAGGW